MWVVYSISFVVELHHIISNYHLPNILHNIVCQIHSRTVIWVHLGRKLSNSWVWSKSVQPQQSGIQHEKWGTFYFDYLHTLSLYNVNVVLRPCIIPIQAQSSPEIGPQFTMTGNQRANYFSENKTRQTHTKSKSWCVRNKNYNSLNTIITSQRFPKLDIKEVQYCKKFNRDI